MMEQRNSEIVYWDIVRNKPQSDIGRMYGNITRQRVNAIIGTRIKHFMRSPDRYLSLFSPSGKPYTFTKAQIQERKNRN